MAAEVEPTKKHEPIPRLSLQEYEPQVEALYDTIDRGHVVLGTNGAIAEVRGYVTMDGLPFIFRVWPKFGPRELPYDRPMPHPEGKNPLSKAHQETQWYPLAPHSPIEISASTSERSFTYTPFTTAPAQGVAVKEFYLDIWGVDTTKMEEVRHGLEIVAAELRGEEAGFHSAHNAKGEAAVQAVEGQVEEVIAKLNFKIEGEFIAEETKRRLGDMVHMLHVLGVPEEEILGARQEDGGFEELYAQVLERHKDAYLAHARKWGVGSTTPTYDRQNKSWTVSPEWTKMRVFGEAVTRYAEEVQAKLAQHLSKNGTTS